MTAAQMIAAAAKGFVTDEVPYFARAWDYREADLSENWMLERDPDNEEGAICTGYFRMDTNEGETEARIEGIRVERDGLPDAYFDRAAVLMLFGKSTVDCIEMWEAIDADEQARAWK